ncbi:hypothetical protein VIGAN_02100400 [Vigna angularis var. angularis]|uniref:RING-type E3 ubiquitin transferase n=1 Tax=Vigna angularis var. angularis TaxID=157739 RepID=A0A0S3RCG9_PHAAN|nr:putative RING-H2 finger protein ATL12 [Vigna angularis]BAT78338.1 hypothetical protein VIGAN_02100400 [Vigna angularis var. angularis]
MVTSPLQKMSNNLKFNPFKKHLLIIFTMILSLPFNVQSQDREEEEQNLPQPPQTLHPSKGIVIAVLATMFAITTILLLYVKFCRVNGRQHLTRNSNLQNFQGRSRSSSRVSGIDKEVVKTLPFFTFSSLKGFKDGLECTVCLSKFEDSETLRLLPKCKHAFHMNCIDKWFESHSTCPLCRRRVEAGDIKNLNYSLSSRFLRVPSNLTEDLNLEIFLQREPSHRGSSRRGFNDAGNCTKQELFIGDGSGGGGGTKWDTDVRVTNLKIVISDVFTRSRWSDLNSSDLLSLNSEMLNDVSSRRLCSSSLESTEDSGKVDGTWRFKEEEKWFTEVNPGEKRCMSEITNVPRFAEMGKENRIGESVWLPIARRTIQWIAKQERNPGELEPKTLPSNV